MRGSIYIKIKTFFVISYSWISSILTTAYIKFKENVRKKIQEWNIPIFTQKKVLALYMLKFR